MKTFKQFLDLFKSRYYTDNEQSKEELAIVVKTPKYKFKFLRSGIVIAFMRGYQKEGKTKTIYNRKPAILNIFAPLNANYSPLENFDAFNTLTILCSDIFDARTYAYDQDMISFDESFCNLSPSVEDEVIKKMVYDELHKKINLLTEKQQQVIQLYFFDNLTQDEIAEILGISRSSVQSRLKGAISSLRAKY